MKKVLFIMMLGLMFGNFTLVKENQIIELTNQTKFSINNGKLILSNKTFDDLKSYKNVYGDIHTIHIYKGKNKQFGKGCLTGLLIAWIPFGINTIFPGFIKESEGKASDGVFLPFDPALLFSLTISIPSMILGEIILNKETITKTSYTISDEEWEIVPN